MKKIIITVLISLFTLAGVPLSALAEVVANPAQAYQAIVQIKVFVVGEMTGRLTWMGSGSGVIIHQEGVVLTNRHVVEQEYSYDNSLRPVAYQICLTEAVETEPNCSYTAKLIKSNKDLDVALLKIEPIEGLSSVQQFPYLNRSQTDSTAIGDNVTVLGYPAIGGETITITKGAISGKLAEDNRKWFKTDAVVSFGNSGGAAINSAGQIIGTTTAANADLLGSLGYIANITSLNSWIGEYVYQKPSENSLLPRIKTLTERQQQFKESSTYENLYLPFTLAKPVGWEISLTGEDGFVLQDESNKEGGYVIGGIAKGAYVLDTKNIAPSLHRLYNLTATSALISISKEKDVVINGQPGKLVTQSALGKLSYLYVFPYQEYLVLLSYDYGVEDQDEETVDSIINSLNFTSAGAALGEVHAYVHQEPAFYLTSPAEWPLLVRFSKDSPVEAMNKDIPAAYVTVHLEKVDYDTRDLDNEEYLSYEIQRLKEVNQIAKSLDYKIEIIDSDAHFKLNDELTDVVGIDYQELRASDDEILTYDTSYYLRVGEDYLEINLSVYSDDEAVYEEALASFNRLRPAFSLKDWIKPGDLSDRESQLVPDETIITEPESAEKEVAVESPSAPARVLGAKIKKELTVINQAMYNRLRGQIMLKVESVGEAYYVHPSRDRLYFLGYPDDAFQVMQEQGVGITDENLAQIPIAVSELSGKDTDGDGLSDIFEGAVGSAIDEADTDGDGLDDQSEIEQGLNPNGAGKLAGSYEYAKKHLGKIFLQVEGAGEAWYVNPADGKRYFLGRPADAFAIMRRLGQGISNSDLFVLTGEV